MSFQHHPKTMYLKKPPSPATPCNSCSRAQTRPRNALRAGIHKAVSTNVLLWIFEKNIFFCLSPLTSDRMRGTTVFYEFQTKRKSLRMRQRRWRCRSPGETETSVSAAVEKVVIHSTHPAPGSIPAVAQELLKEPRDATCTPKKF